VAQILAAAQDAEAVAQRVRDDADAGKFDGKSLFWCKYIETTLSEIVQAVNDGLLPVMRVGSMVYVLSSCSSTVARFYSVRGGAYNFLYWAVVDEDDEWSSGSFSLGDYTKPASGIPKRDLSAEVQDELGSGRFSVVYGETTVAQIDEAVTAGKIPVFAYQNRWYNLAKVATSPRTVYTFTFLDTDGVLYWANCTASPASATLPALWSFGSIDLAGNSI
jgi:hypothetical protein